MVSATKGKNNTLSRDFLARDGATEKIAPHVSSAKATFWAQFASSSPYMLSLLPFLHAHNSQVNACNDRIQQRVRVLECEKELRVYYQA